MTKVAVQNVTIDTLYEHHNKKVTAKWSSYINVYEHFFSPYQHKPICLLELGVQNGGSLEVWSQYFSEAELLIGCDIDQNCEKLHYDDERISLVIGDITEENTYEQVTAKASQYDIIIDDASHRSGDIIKAFIKLFSNVVDGGLYVVEDLHCSYWQAYDGGLYDPYSAISFFKSCIDVINHEHWGLEETSIADFQSGFVEKYGIEVSAKLLSMIESITFVNSMCVIKKGSSALGTLIVTGTEEVVSDGYLVMHGSHSTAVNQQDNIWASQQTFDEASFVKLTSALQASKAALEEQKFLLKYEKEVSEQRLVFMEKTCQQLEAANKQYLQVVSSLSWKLTKPLRFMKRLFT